VRDTLVEYLGDKELLLVVDSCHHLLDACVTLVGTLLARAPRLRMLATSRQVLRATAERVLEVPPLSVPDPDSPITARAASRYEAVRLFTDRAKTARPGFALDAGNWPAVARMCQRLGGVPLAIELAALRMRAMSPAQTLDRLDDYFDVLTEGSRVAIPRLEPLHTAIDWSYDLCPSDQKTLWARVSVFCGDFDLAAVEDICAGGGIACDDMMDLVTGLLERSILTRSDHDLALEDLLDLIASLADKSILARTEAGNVARYRMLDTLREYGEEKLRESSEDTALRRRHRDWYRQLTLQAEADWISPRQADWMARLRREHPNIRAALEYSLTEPGGAEPALKIATALHTYWIARTVGEGRHWLDHALTQPTGPPADRLRALVTNGLLAALQGDHTGASTHIAEARQIARRLGGTVAHALVSQAAGTVALVGGELSRAVALLEVAMEALRAQDNVHLQLRLLTSLTVAYGLLGDHRRALACHERILAITEPRGELWYRAYSLWACGLAARGQGDSRQAAALVHESLRLKRQLDDPLGATLCLEVLAWLAADERDHRRAATLLGAAAPLTQTMTTRTATLRNTRAYHDECERQTRHALGDTAFRSAFHHGGNLTLDEAIAYALHEQPRRPQHPPTLSSPGASGRSPIWSRRA
jgi:predicted ATPase